MGEDGWFYTEEYASTMLTEISEYNKTKIIDYAEKVRMLKDKLEASGKQFLYVITPSKAEVYPENLPARYHMLLQDRVHIQNNYDFLKEQLTLQGVSYIDMTTILKEQKSEIPFFSKTGIHWNYYASALCAEQVVKAVDNNVVAEINITEIETPYGTEQDVYLLSNIIEGKTDDAYYAVDIDYSNVSNIRVKKVLEMGTSFSGELESQFFPDNHCVWNQYIRYQYFAGKTSSKGEKSPYVSGDFYNEELKTDIANADVVVIENNNSYVPDSHYQFVDYILSMSEEEMKSTTCINLDKEELSIDFSVVGNADEYISSGFYSAEEMGRWAMPKAEFFVDVCATQDLVIKMEDARFPANTSVLFNDTVVWQTEQATDAVPEIIIPISLINNGGVNYITITTDESIQSPKELGVGEDSRILSHWMHKVILRSDVKGGI